MQNSYEVADKVKIIVHKIIDVHGEKKDWEDIYAGTVVTYKEITNPRTGEIALLYKVSVDGLGDVVIAKEVETDPGTLTLVDDYEGKGL